MEIPVFAKSQTWIAAVAIGLLTAASSIDTVRAGGLDLTLPDLAGPFAGNAGGFRTICGTISEKGFIPTKCSGDSPDVVAVQFTASEILQGTRSPNGDLCFTVTDVAAPLGGSRSPAMVSNYIIVGSSDSYDPTTGKGSITLTFFNAGDGVDCKGATLTKPDATSIATGTQDFTVVKEPALHLDGVITSLTDPARTFGATVLSSTVYSQGNRPRH